MMNERLSSSGESPRRREITDVAALRQRACQRVEEGAATDGYAANCNAVVEMSNSAVATESGYVPRYKRRYFMASGIHPEAVVAEFLEHAGQEMEHTDRLAKPTVQLQGEPNISPAPRCAR